MLFLYILKSAAVPSLLVRSDFVRDGTFEHFITKNYLALTAHRSSKKNNQDSCHMFQNLNLKTISQFVLMLTRQMISTATIGKSGIGSIPDYFDN